MNNKILGIVCALALFASCTKLAMAQEWIISWSDEFNEQELDRSKWNYENGFVRNEEEQYFTNDPSNIRLVDGFLIMEAHKTQVPNEMYDPNYVGGDDWKYIREHAEYTSSSILTRDLVSVTHGRIEMRSKLPGGKGNWLGFWTTGDNYNEVGWPECGEIDIMEYVGRNANTIYGTVHFADNGAHKSEGGQFNIESPGDFHVYAAEWDTEQIVFSVDNIVYKTFLIGDTKGFRSPHILRLSFSLGGFFGGDIDDSIFPQRYVIDYVRVYKPRKEIVSTLQGLYRLLLNQET